MSRAPAMRQNYWPIFTTASNASAMPRTMFGQMQIRNTKEGALYYLAFATKDPLGNKIWQSITSIEASGQRSLF